MNEEKSAEKKLAPPTLLIVDDEESVRYTLEVVLKSDGYIIKTAASAVEALERLNSENFDLIISDVSMPGASGIDLLNAVKKRDPEALVILITAYGSEALAVEAMKSGAYDYLAKPFANDDLKLTVRRAIERKSLKYENQLLRQRLHEREGLASMVGAHESMQRIYDLIERIAPNDVTVLITGESGTGKELVANAIHTLSRRKEGPFITVNCAALPEALIESELFGYEKGAFSGAVGRRLGKFELAHNGTIFLDEIGDMSTATQTKVLRILQEHEFERLGGQNVIHVDVRVIAATNRDLLKAIRENRFREDLFYRLNVVNVHLPPLRERRSDIPLLVEHFSSITCKKFNKPVKAFSKDFMSRLIQYSWPGNVRELQNLVERMIILEDESMILGDSANLPLRGRMENESYVCDNLLSMPYKEAKDLVLKGFERKYFETLLAKAHGNISLAARLAGMHRKNLYLKLKELNMAKSDTDADDE